MIDPPSTISGSAFWTVKRVPRTFRSNVLSKCSSVTSPIVADSHVAGVGEQHVDTALFALHDVVEPVEIGEVPGVALNAGDVPADRLHRVVELLLAPPRDEDVGALVDKQLRRRERHAGRSGCDDCDFAVEPSHISSDTRLRLGAPRSVAPEETESIENHAALRALVAA